MIRKNDETDTDGRTFPELPCACASLRRAARAVTQLYDEALRPAGLRVTQFTLLHVLAETGDISQGRIGQLLALDSTTLSRTLRLVESLGWITSAPGEDRRRRHYQLTVAGRRKLTEAMPCWQQAQGRLRAMMRDADWAGLFHVSDLASAAAKKA